jgi:hypothetical protein
MSRWNLFVIFACACSFPRPADVVDPKNCADGICRDPAHPFCDVGGEIGGAPLTCVAVACAPGELAACRADTELTCNTFGTGYDVIQCERGCDPVAGCRVCQPNQTVCANGRVQTCDATGAITSSETCPLGCFEDQPRCRNIDASNDLSRYLGMVTDPPDIDLTDVIFDTGTGTVQQGSTRLVFPSFLISSATDGIPPIRVFVANHVHLKDVTSHSTTLNAALAIIAHHDIMIEGRARIDSTAGSVVLASCAPEAGQYFDDQNTIHGVRQVSIAGDGGGSHATDGSSGGDVDAQGQPLGAGGGLGGRASGTDSLVPLRGGCIGAGALQISSNTSVTINGVIDARGADGLPARARGSKSPNGGGGAGGGILIEAPSVTLGPAARLIAKGGAGAANASDIGMTPANDETTPAIGWRCAPADPFCGNGGDGASVGIAATAGATIPYSILDGALVLSAGGGGGGMGRVRINTRDGAYTKSSTTVEAAALTTGVIKTR